MAGEFFDSAAGLYSGFFYDSATQAYTGYDVPGQPPGTATAVLGMGDTTAQFCGSVSAPPYTVVSAFISLNGQVTVYSVGGSFRTECTGMNKRGASVGYYNDASGVSHGFERSTGGILTTIDFPGASKVAAALPCGGIGGGTVAAGISDRFDISGHFWDSSNNEHGFARTPGGFFQPIDFPGAFQTGGGGTNNQGTVVGHYRDSACAPSGYIARRAPH